MGQGTPRIEQGDAQETAQLAASGAERSTGVVRLLRSVAHAGIASAALAGIPVLSGCSSEHAKSVVARSGLDPAAEHNLGKDYYYGENGKPRDRKEAYQLFKRAAEKGLPAAQHALGLMFLNGDREAGVPRDPEQAEKLFRSAAENGLAAAAESLAEMYERGVGIERDLEAAEHWKYRAGFLRYEKETKRGNVRSMFWLGCYYRDGIGVERDVEKALYWFKKAAEKGDSDSVIAIRNMNNEGAGAEVYSEEAKEWLKKILDRGSPERKQLLEKLRKHGASENDVLEDALRQLKEEVLNE